MATRFNDAWSRIRTVAEDVANTGTDVVLVRDILGRVSLVVDRISPEVDLDEFAITVRRVAGPFSSPEPIHRADELFLPEEVLASPDLLIAQERSSELGRIAILERGIVGGDWIRPNSTPDIRRVALYGFKGGVGRSTATFMLAQDLASRGLCVLVVDLDLESPGVGALVQGTEGLPDFGIIDLLVESAVNNEVDLEVVCRSQIITGPGNGEVWLAPAAGRNIEGYLSKLNRIYSDLPASGGQLKKSFGARLDEAVTFCDRSVTRLSRRPDVILLDSRAGIHDIAAVTLTQLSGFSFLFAADNPQTWAGYHALFEQWRNAGAARAMGEKIKIVSSMTPNQDGATYLSSFSDHAQECFADTLYESADSNDLDAFNFSADDPNAPHFPIPITFNSDLVTLAPDRNLGWHTQKLVQAAFEPFLQKVTELIIEGDQ